MLVERRKGQVRRSGGRRAQVVQTLLLILKLMPMVLEIIKLIQLHRLTEKATEEMIADLEMTADYLVTRSKLARAEVKDTPDAIKNDPDNRNR